jgi:hypothetical protein
LSTIVGARPHRSNAKKHKRILELVSDPAAAAEVSDHIAAGFDGTDMRFLNGARDDPAFGPYFASPVEILEQRSQLATHDRRYEGADDAMVLSHAACCIFASVDAPSTCPAAVKS